MKRLFYKISDKLNFWENPTEIDDNYFKLQQPIFYLVIIPQSYTAC